MARASMPREVRPAFGPFVEAVPLLVRQETLEIAGILAILPITVAVLHERGLGDSGPSLTIPGGLPLPLTGLALSFGSALLWAASVLLLIPVACGIRGLRPRILLDHFGVLALAAAVPFGAGTGAVIALFILLQSTGVGPGVFLNFVYWWTPLSCWLTVWSAWFLCNSLRRREGRPSARRRLLAWPGVVIAVLPAGVLLLLTQSGFVPWKSSGPYLRFLDLGSHVLSSFLSNLLYLFAALWMVRVVENEADDRPPMGWPPRQEMGE